MATIYLLQGNIEQATLFAQRATQGQTGEAANLPGFLFQLYIAIAQKQKQKAVELLSSPDLAPVARLLTARAQISKPTAFSKQ